MDIAEFLTARYDEREKRIRSIKRQAIENPWRAEREEFAGGREDWKITVHRGEHGWKVAERMDRSIAEYLADVADPQGALADIASKRRILALHGSLGGPAPLHYTYCETCGSGEPYQYPTDWPCDTLKLLAAPYDEHPDFQPEWRIDG